MSPNFAFRASLRRGAAVGVEQARVVESPSDSSLKHLHRYVYRQPPPWPEHRRSSVRALPYELAEPAPEALKWPKLDSRPLTLRPLDVSQGATVPNLAHGLERVLRSGGLHSLDTVSERSSFTSNYSRRKRRPPPSVRTAHHGDYLRTIVQPDRIAWDHMPSYVPAKHDARAHEIAANTPGVRYMTSTSSITPTLASLYHLLSNFRSTELVGGLSLRLSELPSDFTKFQRRPVAIDVSHVPGDHQTGVYSINSHQAPHRGPAVLMQLGHSIEHMLTMSPDDFLSRFVLSGTTSSPNTSGISIATEPTFQDDSFYHYSVASSLLFRAQIDCRDAATGNVFDVKTRAVAAIRYDLPNYLANATYRLRALRGVHDSYEREFYDMVRSVFIKYALQLRIGRMHGAFVAYHNTSELLAMEYVSLAEIESYVFGGTAWADVAFGTSIRLLEKVLARVHEAMLDQNQKDRIKVVFSTDRTRRRLTVFAQRIREGEDDPLGADVYHRLESNLQGDFESTTDRLRPSELWHADATLHRTGHAGVASVGGSEILGGEKLVLLRTKRRKKPVEEGNALYDIKNHDVSKLGGQDFYVWNVDVVPLIDGLIAPKGSMDLGEAGNFELRYRMNQVKNVTDYVKAHYILELGRLYVT